MGNPLEQFILELSPEKRTLLAELLRPQTDPIAIIGMGCRFPGGAGSPDAFWNLLAGGVDAISEVPPDRWNIDEYYDPDPEEPGKMYTRWGGFIPDLAMFDATFFGIVPQEALRMDPQQRMLVETAWETVENAGYAAKRLAGTRTGLFLGVMPDEYLLLQAKLSGLRCFDDPYLAGGYAGSMAAGRLSFMFDFRGPAIAVDTGCSSSLVSLHLACQSLRNGECDMALAGGVNAIVVPEVFVQLCKLHMLSRDGRCKTFDALADGFVAGEGCGLVVLKRLGDAVRDRDHIAAVILGSAVNEDGRTSSPTAPSGLAQQAVIRKALHAAGVDPRDVDYVEAHGSGTALGDPIEIEALGEVLGVRTGGQPLLVGTVKTNVGHLECAAGIAGLIKTVLALEHKQIPPHRNFSRPNPGIAWDKYPIAIPRSLTQWPFQGKPRIAGVSSFGWAGTNAHVIVREGPASEPAHVSQGMQLLILSGKSQAAVESAASRLAAHLRAHSELDLADVAYTLQVGREEFQYRRWVVCCGQDDAIRRLEENTPIGFAGDELGVALVFPDDRNSSGTALGELYASQPGVREEVDLCASILQERLLLDLKTPILGNSLPQAAVFIQQYVLGRMLIRHGIRVRAMLGVKAGYYTAACLAGMLSLEEALLLVARGPAALSAGWITSGVAVGSKADPVPVEDAIRLLCERRDFVIEVGEGEDSEITRALGLRAFPLFGSPRRETAAVTALLATLGSAWSSGASVNWDLCWSGEPRRRVPLPSYPFERKRYWIEPARDRAVLEAVAEEAETGIKKPDVGDWFYLPVWEKAQLGKAAGGDAGRWLVLEDEGGVGERLAELLEQAGHRVVRAAAGARAGLKEVFGGQLPTGVVHLGSLDIPGEDEGRGRFGECQQKGFYSVLGLARELGREIVDKAVQLVIASRGMQAVRDGESGDAEQATLIGLCKVIGQENPTLTCRSIDVDAAKVEESAAQIAAECEGGGKERVVAYRGGQRWRLVYTPLRVERRPADVLLRRGVYLITGGLGGVGLVLAEYLARRVQARLVLVGRSGAQAQQGERLARIEELGGEVEVVRADVGNRADMRRAVERAEERFGGLNGVVHAAGITTENAFGPIQELSIEQCEMHFQPKVRGVYALEEALAGRELDFCILFSSLAAVLGGLGFGGYAAANSFMDAFAQRHNRRQGGQPWTSVNWDTWRLKAGGHEGIGATVAQYEMLPEEGAEAFTRVLGRKEAQIVNSTGDLEARIRQWVELESLGGTPAAAAATPSGLDYEERIARVWRQVLGVEQVGREDNFFDLGGNSLVGLQVIARLKKEFQRAIPAVALFEAPTVSALAEYLRLEGVREEDREVARLAGRRQLVSGGRSEIAIIGMTGRFPGAETVEEFWENLRGGVESLSRFSDEELLASGVDEATIRDPNYVKARPILRDVEHFDAGLFGYTPREAEMMDPQQRLFQECAWEALEKAGYDPQRYAGLIGVFAGSSLNSYLLRLAGDPVVEELISESTVLENDKDALTLNVSYRLNLRGPSVAVQTFCSTSLVAVHMACRSLRNGECDMVLAGGVSVRVPVKAGYLYQEGNQVSHDGHCRTFDAAADGTMFGDGAAIVVLKRLADALEDGDTVHAVIKGSAVNNDGGLKVGYTAPSVVGQAAAVEAALADAGVGPEGIDYVEAHGTATRLGDPIEVASLTKAFRRGTEKRGYCALGSVKPNVGHVDRAAGVTGLIKTVLSLEHEEIPATLHFERANPEIDFVGSPFYVNTELKPWRGQGRPRRGCVNSLGVGGTNAHVVVEEAPAMGVSGPSRAWELVVVSGRTEGALEAGTERLRGYLEGHAEVELADAAYTLQVGRRVMEHRRMLVCRNREEAVEKLGGGGGGRGVWTKAQKAVKRTVALVYAGVGEHYAGWGSELYAGEAVFRGAVDRCCRLLQPQMGGDLREVLLGKGRGAGEELRRTGMAQPAAFVMDYALGQLWQAWGIRPAAVLGYSVGEYVAACVAGVLSLEDALRLVAGRAQAIERLPGGAMLAVSVDEEGVKEWLGEEVWLAAVNSPAACVVGGREEAIAALERRLEGREIACRRVETSHAFHTPLLRPVAGQVTALARGLKLQAPRIPCLSNVTGTWMTAAQAMDPSYWAEHLCEPVRFAEGVGQLLEAEGQVVLEVGPGASLASFMRQHPKCGRARMEEVLSSLPPGHQRESEVAAILTTLGKLWLLGVEVDWVGFHGQERRRRIPLPTYPFERRRYWIEPSPQNQRAMAVQRRPDIADWFAVPSWKRTAVMEPKSLGERRCWLLLLDGCGVGAQVAQWLAQQAQEVVTLTAGANYARRTQDAYTVRPGVRGDYEAVLQDLQQQGKLPQRVVHLWMVSEGEGKAAEAVLERGFYSLMALTQALGDCGVSGCHVDVVSSGMQEVLGTETVWPAKAAVLGPVKVIPQEYPNLSTRSIDIGLPVEGKGLIGELVGRRTDEVVALRGGHRWVQGFEAVRLEGGGQVPLRERGVYLITGGLGGIGMALARDFSERVGARLVLVGRTARRTAAVAELEAHGAEVLVVAADVAEEEQIAAAVQAAVERFGTIQGVLHTAGVPGIGLMQLKTEEAAARVLRPKVQGTLALVRALEGLKLDFLVLFSSVTSATGGGPGQVDYCAANAFLDAWARRHCAARRTISVSWGEWQWDAWQEGLLGFPEEARRQLIANRQHYGIEFEEGAEALRRVLASGLSHVFVTTQDLAGMVDSSRRSSAASALAQLEEQRRSRPLHPRPILASSYVAPENEVEQKIAAIWGHALGIQQIGTDDNFFELGGNSLLGIDIVARLRKELRLDRLPSHILYDTPTVGTLARRISGKKERHVAVSEEREGDNERRQDQLDYFRHLALPEEVL